MNTAPFISIVIPAYNEEKNIERCIDSLRAQDYPGDRCEIIVADNGSTDKTREILKKLNVKYFVETKKGRPSVLNLGIKNSKGEIIVFTDADCIPEPNWLTNVVKGFSEPLTGCVAGEIKILGPEGNPLVEFQKRKRYFSPELLRNRQYPYLPAGCGANLAFRRDVFDKIGYFDEDCVRSEDTDICFRMQIQTDYKISYAFDAVIYHKCETSLLRFLKQRFNVGRGQVELRNKYKDRFKKTTIKQKYWTFHSLFMKGVKGLKFWFKGFSNKEYKERSYDEFVELAMLISEMLGRAYWRSFVKSGK